MPVYTIRGPDGRVYEVKGPNGATAEQLGAFLTENMSNRQVKESAQLLVDKEMADPAKSGTDFQNFRAGFGKVFADLARGVGQNVGLVSRQDVKEARRLDAPLMGTKAGMAGNFIGNATVLAPLAAAPYANTILGAAAYGGATGFMQPSASTEETGKNVLLGAAGSAAVPAAITGYKTVKSLVEPLYEGGRKTIVGRAIIDAGADDPAALAAALRNNRSAVPGVQRTVAEVADNPSLAALQRTATQTNPAVMNDAAARAAANNEARVAALGTVSGDAKALETLKSARADAADVAYRTARQSDAMRRSIEIEQQLAKDAQNVGMGALGNVPKRTAAQSTAMAIRPTAALEKLAERPAFKGYIEEAKRLAANKGQDIGNPLTSIDGLHYIKLALDDALEGTATNALARNAKSAVMDMKKSLIKEMDEISPVYGVAREAYSEASKPIVQMEIGQEIADKAINKVTGNLQPSAYARALSNDTAESVSGMSGATLEDMLDPQALTTLNAVKDDLVRSNFANTAGRGAGSDTVQKLAYSNLLNQAGVPSFLKNFGPAGIVGNLAQRAGQVVYKDANEKLAEQLARALLNPDEAANLVTGAMVTPQMRALVENLRRGGTAIGASAPGLVQANQQEAF